MATWKEITQTVPEFAARVAAWFAADKHAVLATLRADGSPRVSGIEPLFFDELWLGSMPGSRKGADLRRDPRFALHGYTSSNRMDPTTGVGDAKVSGRALEVTDQATIDAYLEQCRAHGAPAPEGMDFELFRADIQEVVAISVEGDQLVVETWRPGQELRRHARK
jgi:Pyridoxamine 5'-phosphate oxidase